MGELFKTSSGGTPLKGKREYYEEGKIPWLTSGEVNKEHITKAKSMITELALQETSAKIPPLHSVLVSMYGSIGYSGILEFEAAINQAICAIHPNPDYTPEWICHFIRSKKDELVNQGVGAALTNISQEKIRKLMVPLVPLSQQKVFTDFIHQIDKSKVIKESVKSRFIEMFGHINLNEKNLPMKTLNEVCLLVTDGSHYSPADEPDGKYPMLSVKDLSNGKFNYSDCKHINQGEYDKLVKDGCKPIKNDVLIAKDGSVFQKSMIITDEIDQVILSSIAIIRPDTDVANPVYLERYLMSDYVKEDVINNYTTGTAIRRIILKNLAKLKLIVPEIEAQNEFASFVQQVDKSKVGAPSAILLINIYINTEA